MEYIKDYNQFNSEIRKTISEEMQMSDVDQLVLPNIIAPFNLFELEDGYEKKEIRRQPKKTESDEKEDEIKNKRKLI